MPQITTRIRQLASNDVEVIVRRSVAYVTDRELRVRFDLKGPTGVRTRNQLTGELTPVRGTLSSGFAALMTAACEAWEDHVGL